MCFLIFLLDIFLIYNPNAIPFPSFLSKTPLYITPPSLLPNQPTLACFLALAFPCTRAYNLHKTRASPPIYDQLGHPLLHIQLDTQTPGVLVSSYFCSYYRVADPLLAPWVLSLAPPLGAL